MKILALNCCGLGQPMAVREVCSLIRLHGPCVVFLSETRLFDNHVDGLVRSFGMHSGIGVGSFGRGGGVALLWSRDMKIRVQSCDKLHIDVAMLDPETDEEKWRFTGFYGEARRELRRGAGTYYSSWLGEAVCRGCALVTSTKC